VATSLEISVVVSTYQRPQHLRRSLTSLAVQRGVSDKFEVIVADDGSQDETASMVAEFRKTAPFALKFYTHPHDGFQLARCRNSGIRASVAPYILFTDGDCIFPPDHLRRHLDARQPGVARAGDCIRIDQGTTERIDEEAIRSGRFLKWIDRREQKSLRRTYVKSLGYQFFGHRQRPKLTGWNMAIWRDDLELVNGFDEKFRGWGCEDDDLAARLRLSGVRIATALGYTHGYHLWHPPHSTTPQRWNEGRNVAYLQRPLVLPRCLEGIRSRSLSQVSTRVIGPDERIALSRELSHVLRESTKGPELEIMVWPGRNGFTAKGARRVIVVPAGAPVSKSVDRMADAIITLEPKQEAPAVLEALQRLLDGQEPRAEPMPRRVA
jgi:glycosyltransferase involved in cell wall biosynthesis